MMRQKDTEEKIRVGIGADHAGVHLKENLKRELEKWGYEVIDVGTSTTDACDYPDFATKVAVGVSSGKFDRGVLICGTGVGMGMVANKLPGVRAAPCTDVYTAKFSRFHTNANVLTMGSRVIGSGMAKKILKTFMKTGFEGDTTAGERHVRRLNKLDGLEDKLLGRGTEDD